MPGEFVKSARPKRPGVYTVFEPDTTGIVPPSIGAIVALPIIHNWGPFKTPTSCLSYGEFLANFGSTDTAGARAVQLAFRGEGVGGRGGAGEVIVYRMGGSTAAKATKTLQNTAVANAITLTAKYQGTRGNDFKVTTQDNAADATKNDLILLDGTTELERYTYADTNVADLVTQINANSDWITATQVATGVALSNVSSQAFTGGDDGTSISGTDVSNTLAGLEPHRFGVLAMQDIAGHTYSGGATATSVLATIKAWATTVSGVQGLNQKGKRFMTVVGGATDETVTTANARSATLNDPNFVNLGVGSVEDVALTVTGPVTLSTSQLAPRVAGILANRGEALSLTFARLGGVRLLVGPTEAEILTAFDGGTTVFSRDSNATAPVRVEKSLTTYTTTSDTKKPYLVYRNPKFVRTMHSVEMELTEWAEENVVGLLPVNDKTRDAVLAELGARLGQREDNEVIQSGSTVEIDQDPPPTDDDEFIALVYGISFTRAAEQVYNTVRVG